MHLSDRIERALGHVEPEAVGETRDRLLRLRHDCGCRAGALLMLVATATTIAYLVRDPGSRSGLAIAGVVAGVLFASAAVGKAVGIAVSRMRLILRLRHLERT